MLWHLTNHLLLTKVNATRMNTKFCKITDGLIQLGHFHNPLLKLITGFMHLCSFVEFNLEVKIYNFIFSNISWKVWVILFGLSRDFYINYFSNFKLLLKMIWWTGVIKGGVKLWSIVFHENTSEEFCFPAPTWNKYSSNRWGSHFGKVFIIIENKIS